MNLTILQDGSEHIFYPNPALPIYVRRGNLRELSGMAALCHWHEDVELLMPYRGYLSYNINGAQVTIPEGSGIFINARNMHYGYSDDGTDCEYVCVTFRPHLLCINEELTNRYVLPILSDSAFTHVLLMPSNGNQGDILNIIKQLDALYQERPLGFEMQAMGLLFDLWQNLFQAARQAVPETAADSSHIPILKRMLEFIRTHYAERITLDQIAAAGGVCRSSCCQMFKKHLGRTPNDYLNSFRLEKGVELLKGSSMSVTEIADLCGFSSSSYFTEMFSKRKGCSPTAFRKQL